LLATVGHGQTKSSGQVCKQNRWSCADKSRILLTSEDGKKWCYKVKP